MINQEIINAQIREPSPGHTQLKGNEILIKSSSRGDFQKPKTSNIKSKLQREKISSFKKNQNVNQEITLQKP